MTRKADRTASGRGTGNPFHYGSPVAGDRFADRTLEVDALVRRMLDGQNVIVLSPRRYGKTSLLLRALELVRRRGGRTGYASLIKASNRREVAEALLAAVLAGPAGWLARRRTELARLLAGLRIQPTVTVHPNGSWQVTFAAASVETAWEGVLEDSLRILATVAKSHPTSLVIDEFQRAAEIDAGLPGVFKAIADELRDVSLVFAGSKLHVMRELSSGPGAPLLGMGERIVLDVIPEDAMTRYLTHRATAAGKHMSTHAAGLIYAAVDGIPNDVQRLAFEAFLVAGDTIDEETVAIAMQRIVSHQSTDYGELYERLAPTQQRVLRALACEPTGAVYAASFLHDADVTNPNSVRAAIDVLEGRELLRRRDGVWMVGNAFFRAWLCQ